MRWKLPPKVKIYEAFGAVAGKRIKPCKDGCQVTSSDCTKTYQVRFSGNKIYSNDNASYWQGYIGYPAIAYLIYAEVVKAKAFPELARIPWKTLNTKYRNDYDKTIEAVNALLGESIAEDVAREAQSVLDQLRALKLEVLEPRTRPA